MGKSGKKNEKADWLKKKQIVAINSLSCAWNRSVAKIVLVWAEGERNDAKWGQHFKKICF